VLKQAVIVLAFAVAVWAFCGAVVGIGRQFMSMELTLMAHVVGAPIGASILSWFYFRNFGYTSPFATAAIFVATALTLDVLVVALLIEKRFDMFRSLIGVWGPQALIFAATYLVGNLVTAAPPVAPVKTEHSVRRQRPF
jgi:hypothetical protein